MNFFQYLVSKVNKYCLKLYILVQTREAKHLVKCFMCTCEHFSIYFTKSEWYNFSFVKGGLPKKPFVPIAMKYDINIPRMAQLKVKKIKFLLWLVNSFEKLLYWIKWTIWVLFWRWEFWWTDKLLSLIESLYKRKGQWS